MTKNGICKLTRCHGKFVKSHLIPRGLTRPATSGNAFIEAGEGVRPNRRWDSWYDLELTIRKGEDILEKLDDWAIKELRKHALVWTDEKGERTPIIKPELMPGCDWGIREILGIDPSRLRLFFLSLLWRAAVTKRHEFSVVSLPKEELEQLRLMLLNGDPGPLDFYPAQLICLYTVGEIHNHTPITLTKEIPAYDNVPARQIAIFRFYFDGLVVHIHRHAYDNGYTANQGSLTVGHSDRLIVVVRPYENSFQEKILTETQTQAAATWPEVLIKLSS